MEKKTSKAARVAAIIGIIVILALYLAALICAFIEHPLATSILWSALFSTIVIPVFIFAFSYITKVLYGKEKEETAD